jgi:hypothetical protein
VTLVHVAVFCLAVLGVLLTGAAAWQHHKRPYKLRDLLDLSNDEIDPDWEQIRETMGTPDGQDHPGVRKPDPAQRNDGRADPPERQHG